MPEVRPARLYDAGAMSALLNRIIATGGTTALTRPIDAPSMRAWMEQAPARSSWLVAEIKGEIVGFQLLAPWEQLPPEACDIGTFVKEGQTGLGIGSALFEQSRSAARRLGYAWINANIRADNESGLIYYQSRGFRDWHRVSGHQLANGEIVDKIWKRYDLT